MSIESIEAEPFQAFEIHTVTDVVDPDGPTLYTETVDDADQLRFAQEEGQRIYYTVYGWREHRMIEPEPIPVYSDDSECYLNGEQVTPESLAAWQQWTTTGEPEGTGLTAISDFIEYEDAMNLAKALSATGNVEINDYSV